MAQLAELQEAFKELLYCRYGQLVEGRDIEPGKATVNIPALMSPFPDVIITTKYRVQLRAVRQIIPEDGFAAMPALLSDDEVAELHREGFHEAAKAKRLVNRITYRILIPLYEDYACEVFLKRLEQNVANGQIKGDDWLILDMLKMRWHIIKLKRAATIHFLRLPLIDPCALVKSGMRGVAFLLNQLAPLPPEWK